MHFYMLGVVRALSLYVNTRTIRALFILMVLAICINTPKTSLAYDVCFDGGRTGEDDTSCVHEDMAEYGVAVYAKNRFSPAFEDLSDRVSAIRDGAGHEDEVDHIYGETGSYVTLGHFWDPDPGGIFDPYNPSLLDGGAFFQGEVPNGWQKSQAYWSIALAEYAAGNFSDGSGAYHYLGHVVHHMGDNTIPTHAHVTSHAPLNRDSYENWMSNKYHCCFLGGEDGGDIRIEFDPPTYNHRLTGSELSELTFNHVPKLDRIDPLPYANLDVDIPELAGEERPDVKLLWLLYTTNQIAEFFAADRDDGEAIDPTGWVQADLAKMLAANLRPRTEEQIADNDSCDCDDDPEHDLSNIREYSYLRGIRAIGGLYNLFEQTVSKKPILSIEISGVHMQLPNGTCNDGLIGDVCDFYSVVSFTDVSPTPIEAALFDGTFYPPIISGQNDGDQTEDDDSISPDWKWGHAVENSGYARIYVSINDDDDFPSSDTPIRITPLFSDNSTGGKVLALEVDLAKCLRGEAGAITTKDVFFGGTVTGQISTSTCDELNRTLVTGEESEDDGIAQVTFKVKMAEFVAPTITCAAPDGLWHANDVSIACTATDEGSGLANPDDASFLLWTNVASGTETNDALTNSREVCDNYGNCATAGPIGGNKVDKKAPVITIVEPTATQYVHSATLVLDYSVTDGGSDVATVTATMNGDTTLAGHGLDSGQAIQLLTALPLGEHTFAVDADDNVGNQSPTESVTFELIVTTQSIIDAVNQLAESGDVQRSMVNPLIAKLSNAKRKMDAGECTPAGNMYEAFINHVQAQSDKGVSPVAAQILIADAQYLIADCGIVAGAPEADIDPASAGSNQQQGASNSNPASPAGDTPVGSNQQGASNSNPASSANATPASGKPSSGGGGRN
jgi:hypothetical protein